jgi:hypothetical protein
VASLRCARKREKVQEGKGGARPHLCCRNRAETLQMCRTPARNSSVVRRRFREGAKGDGGGEMGLLIGV